ncbi:MAG: ATP synthase F1 subunit epsilon [Cyclobacteriaceae bacterium]|nr:ATP synthase F1 subunit epsilon [Cyclobacteriaceae bacterium]
MLLLEIITPDKMVFKGEVVSATFPGSKGSFQILKNHAPIISALDKGALIYDTGQFKKKIFIGGGMLEMQKNHIIVLAESASEKD